MKFPLLSMLAFAFLTALLTQAKTKPVDLSEFRGTNFKGTTTLVFSDSVYAGSAVLSFKVPKSGRHGVLNIASNILVSGTPYDTSNVFRFSANRRLSVTHLAPPLSLIPLSGTYRVSKQGINGSALYTSSGAASI